MTPADAAVAGVQRSLPRGEPQGWIQGPSFDLGLFILSPLSGIVVALTALYAPWGSYIGPVAVYLVALPHYLSTFTFYFGDENRAYYRRRWVAFFVGPLICVALVFAAILSNRAALFQTGQFTWNIYHVALQSAGILSIYRWLNGGPPTERRTATLAILAASAAMAFFRLDRYAPMYSTLAAIHPAVPDLLMPAAVCVAVPAIAVAGYRIARRPRRIAVPEGAFFVTSLLLFHPYLWVEDSELATLAMLMGHFVQYLAIVWLLHHRKYGHSPPVGSRAQRFLGSVSRNRTTLLGTLLVTGLLLLVIDRGSRALGVSGAYQMAWNGLVITHFYLDGLIWAFRRPDVRRSIGAYLILEDHRVADEASPQTRVT